MPATWPGTGLRTNDIRGVRSLKLEGGKGRDELAGYDHPTEFFQPFSSQRDFFLWSLKNMSVSFRVKGQYQAASHSPVYSGVAQAAVQPAVGARGGVTASCGSLDSVATFWKISSDINMQ